MTYVQSLSGSQVDFIGTALMPKSHGSAKVATTRGGFKLQIRLAGLEPASQIDPAYLTYVAWAIPTNHTNAQNLGELVLKGDDATLDTFTNLTQFALIITAEPYFAVEKPSPFVVMQNIMHLPQDDPNFVRADLLPLRPDSKTPLEVYEARNAVRIARSEGAERYASDTFHRALQLLQQAENIIARKNDKAKDNPEVREKAREATLTAEAARAAAAERLHETDSRPAATP